MPRSVAFRNVRVVRPRDEGARLPRPQTKGFVQVGVAGLGLLDLVAHDGFDPLRCWRTSQRSVAVHIRKHYWTNRRGQ